MDDLRTRKWLLTINNPSDHGFDHDYIIECCSKIKSLTYFCMCDEVGLEGTYHTHIYLHCKDGVYFSRLKKLFPPAHLDPCKGTAIENRNYIRKEGSKKNLDKADTNLIDTFYESGECPVEKQGARNDLADLYDMIKEGKSNSEIIATEPRYMFNVDKIDKARQTIIESQYKNTFRNIECTYIFGKAGTGKTRSVMEKYGYENVYRVTDYYHAFDTYEGQKIIVFDEFRSHFKISDMLNYLDGYPLSLPARFSNKVACFDKVYIISNLSLNQQYTDIQRDYPETWNALLRRIHSIVEYFADGSFVKYDDIQLYLNRKKGGFIKNIRSGLNGFQRESQIEFLTVDDNVVLPFD